MKLLRYITKDNPAPRWGWLSEDRIGEILGTPFGEFRRQEAQLALEMAQLLPPVQPGKIICVGSNYPAHAAEQGTQVPSLPVLFLKPPSAVIAAQQTILLPPQSKRVEHEAELAVVIGVPGRWITSLQAADHILGYTAANDVTARDLQTIDEQWTRSKSFDTFCPLGPWIETDLDPSDVMVSCTVNNQMRQMASTRDMIFPVPNLVAFISSIMTLEAGDVILTGTPAGVGPLQNGDEVVVEIEKVGALINPVQAPETESSMQSIS
jgi:2-keto-4-pentenoate hydratase/2-oxohepta-3-ene-1,7-dioic acid hydratase in catechol pathway